MSDLTPERLLMAVMAVETDHPDYEPGIVGLEWEKAIIAWLALTEPLDVERLAKALAVEFGKAGFFQASASMDFLTQQARLMLADIAHTPEPRVGHRGQEKVRKHQAPLEDRTTAAEGVTK